MDIDISEHSIIQYIIGENPIYILEYGISMVAKMTKLATMNSITILLMNR
jgi:hypothetical protein